MRKLLYAFLALSLINKNVKAQPPVSVALLNQFTEVRNFVNKPDASAAQPIPPPPKMQFDYCYPCDQARRKAFSQDSLAFLHAYLEPETQYIAKANSVMAQLSAQRKNLQADTINLDHMSSEMLTASEIIQKLMHVGLGIVKQAKKDHDYEILLNQQWILDLYRNLDSMEDTTYYSEFHITEFLGTNFFNVYVETAARSNGDGASQNTELVSEAEYWVVPDSLCHLVWHKKGDSTTFYYKLKTIDVKLKGYGNAPYTGTQFFYSPVPEIKLDFCGPNRDTANFYGFAPYKGKEILSLTLGNFDRAVIVPLYLAGFPDQTQLWRDAYKRDTAHKFTPVSFGFVVKGKLMNTRKDKLVFDEHIDGMLSKFLPTAWFRVRIEHVEK